jgi:DNA replication protein DnaC
MIRINNGGNDPEPEPLDPTPNLTRLRARVGDDAKRAEEQALRDINEHLGRLQADLGPHYRYERTLLKSYELYDAAQESVIRDVAHFLRELPARIEAMSGLIFYGPSRTGKDHLLAAMLYHAVRCGYSARWFYCQEFYSAFRDGMRFGAGEQALINLWTRPQVLGISDPLPINNDPSSWNLQQLTRLIETRYRQEKPTWMTVNAVTEKELRDRLTDPLFNRLTDPDGSLVLGCFWQPYHRRHKEEK